MEEQQNVVTPPQQQTPPSTVEETPEVEEPKKTPWLKITIIVLVVLILGSGAFAGYHYNTWPFSLLGPNKESALTMAMLKMQDMETGRYSASLIASSEARDTSRVTLAELFTDEDDQAEEEYNRDNDRLRILKNVLDELKNYYSANQSYPSTLSDNEVSDDFVYQSLSDGQDFELKITFELDQATKAVTNSIRTATIDNKSVTINHSSFTATPYYNFYFYRPPKPLYKEILYGDADLYGDFIPTDISITLNISGLTKKVDGYINAEFKVGGELDAGDLIAAAEVEMRKVSDVFYGRINKMPSLFADYADIKQTWVQIKKEDVVTTYSSSPFDYFDKTSSKGQTINDQVFELLKEALTDEVLAIDYSLPDQIIREQEHFVYQIRFNQEKVLPFYQKMANQLKEKYGDDAILSENEKLVEFFQSDSFTKLMTYLDANSTFTVAIDKKTGYLDNFKYEIVLVPGGEGKLGDKQLVFTIETGLSDINQGLTVNTPDEFITFEDAVVLMSGMTHEEYRFKKQLDNVKSIRSALLSYNHYVGTYPGSLDQLTKKRSEITLKEGLSVKEHKGERPFINHIPNDIFTKQPFGYLGQQGYYALTYMIELPPKPDNDSSDPYGYSGISVNTYLSVVSGTNTANNQDLSMEIKEALTIDDDNDGLPNIVENYYGSDINDMDSDDDTFLDGDEVQQGYDPIGPGRLNYSNQWYNSSYNSGIPEPEAPVVEVPAVTETDHQKGSATAVVTIIVYTDFQCPFCKTYHETLNKIAADYPTQVRIVYRHMPLSSLHAYAVEAAEASECANEQEKFWEYADKLFANQTSFNNEYFSLAATELSLDKTQFDSCFDSNKYALNISTDSAEATTLGLGGTPASFIEGEKVAGAVSYDVIKEKIDSKLK